MTVTDEEVTSLWLIFVNYDKEGIGKITRDNFFGKICEEPRNYFGDSIFELIGV